MADRPNRPFRPRQGASGPGRRRRVVIDTGAGRPRQDGRQQRDRQAERPKERREVVEPTGPITVPSGVTVKDLSAAIGKEGMNARLAARLTGWKIDIQSDTEFAQAEAEIAFGGADGEGEDISGRCSAILSNGKRCPNAALPGSRFCGVPAHQALVGTEADTVAIQSPEVATQEEVAELEPIGANDPTSDQPELVGEDGPALEAAVMPVDAPIEPEARDEG